MQKKYSVGWFVFLVYLSITFRIAFFIYFVLNKGDTFSADSYLYINLANNLADIFEFSRDSHEPFSPEVFRTPGYPAFLAVLKLLGIHNIYWIIFCQEIIFLVCVLIFFYYGRTLFSRNTIRISVLFMLLEPGGLAYPKEFLTEVLFLPWITSGLLAIGYYCRFLKIRYLFFAGLLFGVGAMVRPGIIYLPIVITIVLIVVTIKNKKTWWHACIFIISFALSISPWLVRNYYHFDKVFMSGQLSNMIVGYHAPIVLQSAKGWSFEKSNEYIQEQIMLAEHKQQLKFNRTLSTVEKFQLEKVTALHELLKYPITYIQQWLFGLFKTMNSAHILEIDHELHIPIDELSFHTNSKDTFFGEILRFLQKKDHLYVAEVIIRTAITIFALLGTICIIKTNKYFLWIVMLTNFYFICAPGPVGYARFRFAIEVFWFIQATFGFIWCIAEVKNWLSNNGNYHQITN